MMDKIKYLDLFAGCGGLSDGFLQTEMYEEVAAVEWLKPQVNTLKNRLKKKWGVSNVDRSVLHFDIQREEELFHGWENDKEFGDGVGLDKLVEEAEGIDIVIGGPPCQAYSIAGRVRDKNGMANDYRNYLFEHYLNVVSRYQPKLFVFENVPGMLSAKPGSGDVHVTDLVRSGFDSIGYEIIDNLKEAVVNASDFGVPQNRKRVIIIGVRKDIPSIANKHQEILQNFYTEGLAKYKVSTRNTVEKAIGDLQKFVPIKNDLSKMQNYEPILTSGLNPSWHEPNFHSERAIKMFRLLAKDIELSNNEDINRSKSECLDNKNLGTRQPNPTYHVLRRNQPSTTITALLYRNKNRFIHYDSDQSRTLTPREAARLQSFDDDFEFLGTRDAVYQMIGNAMPPLLAKSLAFSVNELYNKF